MIFNDLIWFNLKTLSSDFLSETNTLLLAELIQVSDTNITCKAEELNQICFNFIKNHMDGKIPENNWIYLKILLYVHHMPANKLTWYKILSL